MGNEQSNQTQQTSLTDFVRNDQKILNPNQLPGLEKAKAKVLKSCDNLTKPSIFHSTPSIQTTFKPKTKKLFGNDAKTATFQRGFQVANPLKVAKFKETEKKSVLGNNIVSDVGRRSLDDSFRKVMGNERQVIGTETAMRKSLGNEINIRKSLGNETTVRKSLGNETTRKSLDSSKKSIFTLNPQENLLLKRIQKPFQSEI
jgi:hypothetical protein